MKQIDPTKILEEFKSLHTNLECVSIYRLPAEPGYEIVKYTTKLVVHRVDPEILEFIDDYNKQLRIVDKVYSQVFMEDGTVKPLKIQEYTEVI